MLIGLIIWWCEGTKIRKDKRWKNSFVKVIEVTNCNHELIKIFIDFLKLDLNIPVSKMKAQIQVHRGDDVKKIEKFWQSITGIPKIQFNKTIIREVGHKPGKNLGTFKVRVYGRDLFDKLQSMFTKELGDLLIIE